MKKEILSRIIGVFFLFCFSFYSSYSQVECALNIHVDAENSDYSLVASDGYYPLNFENPLPLLEHYGFLYRIQTDVLYSINLFQHHFSLISFFRKSSQIQFSITSKYIVFCSEKQLRGYYLYNIRKLQI